MCYILISGIVKDLNINKTYEDLAFNASGRNLVGIASIASAAIGEVTSSTILANSSRGAEVDMEYFTCSVNEICINGKFHKVGFKDGEFIDFIVIMNDGIAEAYGARNPAQRLIWTLPYQTRGHIAQKWNNVSSTLNISSISALLSALFAFFQESEPLSKCWKNILEFSVIGFFIILVVNILVRIPVYKFSVEATKIFKEFGFKDPENIDLQKSHNTADKNYYKEIGQERPWKIIPWEYRYNT